MPDMLVKLYHLPPLESLRLRGDGFVIRRARSFEMAAVADWVEKCFNRFWASEAAVAFSRIPVSCFIATIGGDIAGFACYDCTAKGFFGPIGVAEEYRKKGIGYALLLYSLYALRDSGYAYAIIGAAGPVDFYKRAVGAIEIGDSEPGFYEDRLKL
ncbi:GNAT family N-acetyltransferase [Spirochaetia bacterium 38H-sp]|uniref:GNAT family N-acetyltransferase n=1 Tax=Rarispira pelagica TaxID=3141764 RepID=A0ABU9UDX9_9SPIR